MSGSLLTEVIAELSFLSDKRFLDHLKKRKYILLIGVILVVAVVFIIAGSSSDGDSSSDQDSLEVKISDLCRSIDGVGECRALIYYKSQTSRYDDKKVESIVIVCEGGDSMQVKSALTEMLSSLFGIGTNRVRVEKMQK